MNIRARVDLVKKTLDRIARGEVPLSDVEKVLSGVDYQLHMIWAILEEKGDKDGPACCFWVEDGKIGCGRYVDKVFVTDMWGNRQPMPRPLSSGSDVDKAFVTDILAPPNEFNRYCKRCRATVREKLLRAYGRVERARALRALSLEEILSDLEKLHWVQRAIDHLHVPITCNEELLVAARGIFPYAKSLPYHEGPFKQDLVRIVFGKTSTYKGSGWMDIAQSSQGQSSIFVELSHELSHLLVGVLGANEATVSALGLETSAVMALDGDRNHEISLYRTLKNLASYTAYVKARREGQVDRWRAFLIELYTAEEVAATEEGYRKCFAEEWEDGLLSFGTPLSQYMLVPYLALKEALSEGRDYIPQSDIFEKEMTVGALLKILGRVLV